MMSGTTSHAMSLNNLGGELLDHAIGNAFDILFSDGAGRRRRSGGLEQFSQSQQIFRALHLSMAAPPGVRTQKREGASAGAGDSTAGARMNDCAGLGNRTRLSNWAGSTAALGSAAAAWTCYERTD